MLDVRPSRRCLVPQSSRSRSLGAFGFVRLVLSARLLACWLKHGVWLCCLTDDRRCPAADLWPLYHTDAPAVKLLSHLLHLTSAGVLFLHGVFCHWPCKPCKAVIFPDAGGCSALTCWFCIVLFIDCALGPCCLPLTVPLCVCLVLYNHPIGCHWHWLTLRASSELVILSICPPTAQVINIRVTVQNATPGVTVAHFARQSPSTPVLLSENWTWWKDAAKPTRFQVGVISSAAVSEYLLKSAQAKIKPNNLASVSPLPTSEANIDAVSVTSPAGRSETFWSLECEFMLYSTQFCQLLQAETQNLACVELN